MVNIPKINMFVALQFPNAQLPAVTGAAAAAAGNRIIVRPLIHFDDDDSGSTTDSDEF